MFIFSPVGRWEQRRKSAFFLLWLYYNMPSLVRQQQKEAQVQISFGAMIAQVSEWQGEAISPPAFAKLARMW
jgi:hypothetical protein